MSKLKIINPHGLQGPAWRRAYETRDAAAEAIRHAYGWREVVMSPPFADDDGTARACYPSQEACDADQTAADAPWIVTEARK